MEKGREILMATDSSDFLDVFNKTLSTYSSQVFNNIIYEWDNPFEQQESCVDDVVNSIIKERF